MMRLLYPSDPFAPREVDAAYADEFAAASARGLACSLFSIESLADGVFQPRPGLAAGDVIVYRGWMMTGAEYQRLADAVARAGAAMLTAPANYLRCHQLPGWYASCADVTPRTELCRADADFDAVVTTLGWTAYFVKDYVKSLTTSRGSVARSADEIREIVALIEKYRGRIEGGICLREFEAFAVETEERYFAYRGQCYAREGDAPALVHQIAARIDAPFFSIDMARRNDGQWRLVEIGDGQVSDRKQWPVERFVDMLGAS